MFIVERSSFRLTKTFYIAFAVSLIVLGAGAAWWGVLLTMHIHLGPKIAPENLSEVLSSSVPEHVPECDLPPLPDRQGPFAYKGYPYYLYPNGEVDGYTQHGWWRISLTEFMRHIDKITAK
jgi:hypothetical protein